MSPREKTRGGKTSTSNVDHSARSETIKMSVWVEGIIHHGESGETLVLITQSAIKSHSYRVLQGGYMMTTGWPGMAYSNPGWPIAPCCTQGEMPRSKCPYCNYSNTSGNVIYLMVSQPLGVLVCCSILQYPIFSRDMTIGRCVGRSWGVPGNHAESLRLPSECPPMPCNPEWWKWPHKVKLLPAQTIDH